MLCAMRDPLSFFLPAELPPPVERQPGLWLAAAPLAVAAAAAAQLSPEAAGLADGLPLAAPRRAAFLAGRAMAALALHTAGLVGPVGRNAEGAPLWPEGSVGSIAHDAARAVAVAGHRLHWAAVGVDVEPDAPLPADAASLVLRPEDQIALVHGFGCAAGAHSRLVFGAKECVHKVINPWRGAWLEFDEVRTEWWADQPDAGGWRAVPVSARAIEAFAGAKLRGEWWRADGALWTLLAVSR